MLVALAMLLCNPAGLPSSSLALLVRFIALASSKRADRSVQTEDWPSGVIFLSFCIIAVPLKPFSVSIIHDFSSFMQRSLFHLNALLSFGPFCLCSIFNPILLVLFMANIPSTGRDSWCQTSLEL